MLAAQEAEARERVIHLRLEAEQPILVVEEAGMIEGATMARAALEL